MKPQPVTRLLAVVTILFCISCGQDPPEYRNKYAYRIDWNGEFFRTNRTQMMWPEFWVYCRNGVQDCYRTVQENQGYGYVTVYLQRFYQAYSADTLDKYFDLHKEDFLTLFPDIETHQPGAVDSLADGHFFVAASAKDSSILVFRDKNGGPVLSNLVFAIERADN